MRKERGRAELTLTQVSPLLELVVEREEALSRPLFDASGVFDVGEGSRDERSESGEEIKSREVRYVRTRNQEQD